MHACIKVHARSHTRKNNYSHSHISTSTHTQYVHGHFHLYTHTHTHAHIHRFKAHTTERKTVAENVCADVYACIDICIRLHTCTHTYA
jgi:hypothetical protein